MKLNLKNIESIYSLLIHPILKDKRFFLLSSGYTCLIALLYLALPISIEALISTITSTANIQPIIIVSVILFFLLLLSGTLTLFQKYLIEIYYRSSFVRLTSDFFLKVIYSNKILFDKFNTSDLNGRYFEIFNIQKSVSVILLEGLLILLQLLVSIILVSFYHPYLFLLNLICIISLVLIWRVFFNRAIQVAIHKSHAKFKVFSWLHDMFRLNELFKSMTNKTFAINKARHLMEEYIQRSKQYWGLTLKQNILLIVLYLFMTMSLFSIGGILVIKGQLSLGQLVAAEIIFTGVLYSISKLGYYFDLFYNLVASAEELQDVFSIKNENLSELLINDAKIQYGDLLLTFRDVLYSDSIGTTCKFNLTFKQGHAYLLIFETTHLREIFISLLKNYIDPQHGLIQFNQVNISLYNQHALRDQIFVIDNADIFSCTIREFLLMNNEQFDHESLQMILDLVGIDKILINYMEDLDTKIIGSGYPLKSFEIVMLKLARALILKPKVLILTDIIASVPSTIRKRIINHIAQRNDIILLHFSTHIETENHYDSFIFLSNSIHIESNNLEEFEKMFASVTGEKHEPSQTLA